MKSGGLRILESPLNRFLMPVVLLGSACSAAAQILLFDGGGAVTGIQNLTIGAATWNVSFVDTTFTANWGSPSSPSPTPTFWNNGAGASAAVSAISDSLNNGGSPQLATTSGFAPGDLFLVVTGELDQNNLSVATGFRSPFTATPTWLNAGDSTFSPGTVGPYAVFTAVPEPAQIASTAAIAIAGFASLH